MDRAEHQAWLKELAAQDRWRRDTAEPELQRREVALTTARSRLADTEAAIADLENALEETCQEAVDPDGG